MYFNSNIKFLRKRMGRTQDDVAVALSMKRSTLSGYENAIAQPGITALIAFSKYFRISIDTLVKIDLSALPESQLRQLEKGYDVYMNGTHLRILATTVGSDNEENIELVSEKAKAGYKSGFADPEYISILPTFRLPFLSKQKKYRTFQVSGVGGVPGNASAVTGNVTVTQQTSLGFLSVGPVATNNPTSSTLNFPLGDDRANGVTVALGAGGILGVTYVGPISSSTTHVIFDVTGFFLP